MTHTYTISGMTCKNCVARVKSQLLMTAGIESAEVQLEAPQASITMQQHIATETLQAAVSKAGSYTIAAADGGMRQTSTASWFTVYKPILLIFVYLTGISLLTQFFAGQFSWQAWMQYFMAGFFLVFSFFKLLDVQSFADSYAMYDILARKWKAWGYLYPFAELAMGIAWLSVPAGIPMAVITIAVMGISIIGVLQAVFSKRSIQCACLGAVFKLPMSTITIVEDGLMIGMSIGMLVWMSV